MHNVRFFLFISPVDLPPNNFRNYSRSNDAFYDRGITFPLKYFLNDEVPQPRVLGLPILFRKNDIFVCSGRGTIHGVEI